MDQPSASGTLLRIALFPALVGLITLLALVLPAIDTEGAHRGFILPLVLAPTYGMVAFLERQVPFRRAWNRSHGDVGTDIQHLVFSGAGTNELARITTLTLGITLASWSRSTFGATIWPNHWPPVVQLFLALSVAELGHYVFHRISHEVATVWRVHAAHHSAERLYWLNATRFHPIDLLALLTFQVLPLIALGADARALYSYAIFTGMFGQLQHGNVDFWTGPLDFLFSTPRLHRWHHSPDPREGNTNYGAVFSFWDVAFGTYFRPSGRQAPEHIGIAGMPSFPKGYLGQLLSPFQWQRHTRPISG
jgi:ornithine lipid hydroxylase